MRLPEFLINLFVRFAPVDKETIANLKIQLMEYFTLNTNNMFEKNLKNASLTQRAEELQKQMNDLDFHSPEYEAKLEELEKISSKMETPTITEKIISFLERPVVRVILLISFVFVSRWIAKKLIEVKEPEAEPENEPQEGFQHFPQNGNYYQQPQYNPYGYGGYYPPQPPQRK